MTENVLDEIAIESWSGPFDEAVRTKARTSLERGHVLYFPRLPFRLNDDEHEFLVESVASGESKNISYDPVSGKLQGMSVTGGAEMRLALMINRFGTGAQSLIEGLLGYRGIERARTSYRPVEVEGREYSPRHDDRLLHVDAFPSRPMRGRRILRVFSNVAPSRPRSWNVGEPFESFAKKFLPRVAPHIPGRSSLFALTRVTKGKRSRYDEVMLSLHDLAKLDAMYQTTTSKTPLDFPPGTSWMAYTDQVLHAALGGAFALEQTFHFDIDVMGDPARAPIKVLERLSGKALA